MRSLFIIGSTTSLGKTVFNYAQHCRGIAPKLFYDSKEALAYLEPNLKLRHIHLCLCSTGGVRPYNLDLNRIKEGLSYDIRLIKYLNQISSGISCLTYVSSILALTSSNKNRLYSNQKKRAEIALVETSRKYGIGISILYPGRIENKSSLLSPHVSYQGLSTCVLDSFHEDNTIKRKVIGLDARLYKLIYDLRLIPHSNSI